MCDSRSFTPIAMGLVALLLGGGGGGSSLGTRTPEASVVLLQVSSESVYADQNVGLTWGASNASSCTGSGAWSGACHRKARGRSWWSPVARRHSASLALVPRLTLAIVSQPRTLQISETHPLQESL